MTRSKSIKCYNEIQKGIEGINDEKYKLDVHGNPEWNFLTVLKQSLPWYCKSSHPQRIVELTKSFSIFHIHADFASIMDWDVVRDKNISKFLQKFIKNDLGPHILTAVKGKGWNFDRWNKEISENKDRSPEVLNGLFDGLEPEQPIEVDGKRYAFEYMKFFGLNNVDKGSIDFLPLWKTPSGKFEEERIPVVNYGLPEHKENFLSHHLSGRHNRYMEIIKADFTYPEAFLRESIY